LDPVDDVQERDGVEALVFGERGELAEVCRDAAPLQSLREGARGLEGEGFVEESREAGRGRPCAGVAEGTTLRPMARGKRGR